MNYPRCPQCDFRTRPDPDRPGCWYCPVCKEPVIFDGVTLETVWPSPDEARHSDLSEALDTAGRWLAKLIGPTPIGKKLTGSKREEALPPAR